MPQRGFLFLTSRKSDDGQLLGDRLARRGALADAAAVIDDARNASGVDAVGLEPAMKAHIDARIDKCFRHDTIQSIRAEWMA